MKVHRYLSDLLGSPARVSILRELSLHKNKGYTARELATAAGCGREPARRAILQLLSQGILLFSRQGRRWSVSLNRTHAACSPLQRLFHVEDRSRERFLSELRNLLPEGAESCLLFGSAARRQEDSGSDVDILLILKDAGRKSTIHDHLPAILPSYHLPLSWHLWTLRDMRSISALPIIKDIKRDYVLLSGKDPWQSGTIRSPATSVRYGSGRRKSVH